MNQTPEKGIAISMFDKRPAQNIFCPYHNLLHTGQIFTEDDTEKRSGIEVFSSDLSNPANMTIPTPFFVVYLVLHHLLRPRETIFLPGKMARR